MQAAFIRRRRLARITRDPSQRVCLITEEAQRGRTNMWSISSRMHLSLEDHVTIWRCECLKRAQEVTRGSPMQELPGAHH